MAGNPGWSGSGGLSVTIEGAEQILNAVQTLPVELRKMANTDFRQASKDIADTMAADIATGRYASGAPQALKVSRTAVRKYDRLPVVKIPGKRVGLSGQGGRSATSGRRIKFRNRREAGFNEDRAIAWGATGAGGRRFPGTTRWTANIRPDAVRIASELWFEAAAAIMRRYGLMVG